MFHRRRSIQSLLSTYFVLFALTLLILTVGIVTWMQYQYTRSDTIEALEQASVSVADSVDQQINQMKQISLSAAGSSEMHEVFLEYGDPSIAAYTHNQLRLRLANLLTTSKGFDFSIRQLNIYRTDAGGYGIGEYNGDLPDNVRDLFWYQTAVDAAGRMIITSPHTDPLLNSGDDPYYLSVCRMFFNTLHTPIGFAEVKKKCSSVFSLADRLGQDNPMTIRIYSTDRKLLYPVPGPEEGEAFDYSSLSDTAHGTVKNTVTGRQEYVAGTVSAQNGLLVYTAMDAQVFLRLIYRSMNWIPIFFLVLFALALLLSMLLAHRLSSPIRVIYHFLSESRQEDFKTLSIPDTGIREIDKLRDTLNESIRSTKTATDTMMVLKEQEVQAQMLALQSQMNPHFLFNSLSTVREMAEEGLTEPVANMCEQITEIMRYISSNREQRSPLEEELEICNMYLDCIRMRYADKLHAQIEVPDDMLDLQIPKLCIQLLVENAVRSVTTGPPPWEVRVVCETRDNFWYVTVLDNGPGFDPEVDKALRSQMDEILRTGVLPSLKIQGMGILNIFIRLYLLEGIPFIFDMGSRSEGGAFVTIGGKLPA